MYNYFELNNYKDKNFLLLLFAMVLCFSSFQTILTPSIDFIALSIKNNNQHFYNYATIGSLVATLPQMSALLLGYCVNNIPYKKAINLILGLMIIIGMIMLWHYNNLNLYVFFVIASGILSVALYCSVDRQIVILLSSRIKAYQNDSFIWGSILTIINFKFSNWIFVHYNTIGIIIYSLSFNIIAYLCLRQIPAVDKISSNDMAHHSKLPNILDLLKVFYQHKPLLTFWGMMLLIMFVNSNFTLLFTTKIHHEGIPTEVWSSNMAFMSLGALLGSILCKSRLIRNRGEINVICSAELIFGLCLITFGKIHSINLLLGISYVLGFVNPFVLINMNSLFFKYIANNEDLVKISPVINGTLMSAFYFVCLLGPILSGFLLKSNISYSHLFFITGAAEIILVLLLANMQYVKLEFVAQDLKIT